jgi:hypothetical protein
MGHKWKRSNVPPKTHKSEWIEGVTDPHDAERLVREVWHHAIEDKLCREGERVWYSNSIEWQSNMVARWEEHTARLWIRHRLGRVVR